MRMHKWAWLLISIAALMSGCGEEQQEAAPRAVSQPMAAALGLPDFVSLVEQNAAVVVNISTEIDPRQSEGEKKQRIPELFRHFFEGMDDLFQAPQPPGESMGSGFIISEDGYILSNNHVVVDADRIIVRLQDRRELEAELVGSDPRSDIALLKVEANDLPVARIGSSADLRVGEWVLAIGAPFGFESTVTAGIVSAKQRALPSENYVPFIQTDVAINPGNSGGPLFNLAGEVIGINSQIVSRNGGYMGLSFAIPMDMAMEVVRQLKENGKVSRGWLGVMIQNVDRDLAASFGLDKPMGALVAQVLEDSPAAKAGIQPGDVIVSFNGEEIETSSELPQVVGVLMPGTEAEAEVFRNGERETLTVLVEELPEEVSLAGSTQSQLDSATLGVEVEPLSQSDMDELSLDAGLRVVRVEEGPMLKAGVQQGDVLVSLNGKSLASTEDFEQVIDALPEQGSVPLLLYRNGNASFLAVSLD